MENQSFAAGNLGKSEIAFSQGLLDYNKHHYESARQHFLRALQLQPENAAAAHFVGMTFFETKDYQSSIRYFEKSISLNVKEAESFFYLGLSHYYLHQKEKALENFRKAESLAKEETLHDLAKSYRRNLEGVKEASTSSFQKDRPWFFYASLATQYDSNVSLYPLDITVATLSSDRKDVQIAPRVGGGTRWIQKQKYSLITEASYYQSLYPQLRDYNYGLAHVEVRQQFRIGKVSFIAPIAYDFSILKTTKYLESVPFALSAYYSLGNHLMLQLSQRIRYDDFFQTLTTSSQNRDAWNLQTEPGVYVFFDQKRTQFVKVSYIFETNRAKGDDWDVDGHTFSGSITSPLVWNVNANAFVNYTFFKKFDNVDSILGSRREDTYQSYGMTLSRDFFTGFTVSAQYQFFKNDSNTAFFKNRRHLTGVTFAYHY